MWSHSGLNSIRHQPLIETVMDIPHPPVSDRSDLSLEHSAQLICISTNTMPLHKVNVPMILNMKSNTVYDSLYMYTYIH